MLPSMGYWEQPLHQPDRLAYVLPHGRHRAVAAAGACLGLDPELILRLHQGQQFDSHVCVAYLQKQIDSYFLPRQKWLIFCLNAAAPIAMPYDFI